MRRCSMATVRSCAFPPSSGAIERLDMTGTMARSLEHLRLWLRYERLRAAARRSLEHLRLRLRYERLRAAARRSLEHLRLWLRYERLRAAARRSCRQQGFTLIELLLAIGVMALLAVLSWRGLDGMVRAQETTRQRADEMLVLQAALGQWEQAWLQAAQWARTPGVEERRYEVALLPLDGWQIFYYRGGAWSNPLSSSDSGSSSAPIPDGLRLQITLPASQALAGQLTRDWVNPVLGGRRS